MPKDSSGKYYQNNKESLQKKLLKGIKIFLKKEKKKSNNIVVSNTKIYQKMKRKSFLSIEKTVITSKKKSLIITIRNYLEKDLKSTFDEEYIKAKHQDVF